MVEQTLNCNYQSFFKSFKGIINKKSGVPNARFLMLIFCQFLDHESKTIEAKAVEFLKELQNFIRNKRQKLYRLGLSHFHATTI